MALPVEIERLRRRLTPPPPSVPPLEVQRAAARMRAADAAAQPGARTWTDPEVRPGIRLPPELPTPMQQADIGAKRLVEAIPPAPPGSGPAGARRILSTTAPTVGPNIPQGMPTGGSPGPGGLLGPKGIIQSPRSLQAPLDFNAPLPTVSVPKPVSAQMELPLGPPSGPKLSTARVARPAPPPPILNSRPGINSTVGAAGAGLMLAPDAWRTGAEIKDKVNEGQGFFSAVGNTIKSNLDRSLRATIPDVVAMQEAASSGEPFDPRDAIQAMAQSSNPPTSEHRPAPTPLEAGPMPVTPKLTSLGNGYGVAGANTSGRAGYSNRTYYDPSANVVASGLSSATGGGGFVGAETDAQAAKALQDRAAQNQAAQFNINSMNRGAEAERDLRATRLGVSRGVLDRMEGRNDTEAAVAAAAVQSAPTSGQFNPLSMPGDSFYDTRSRQATYDRAVQQALAGNKREQQGAAAALTALNDFREKNLAAQVAQGKGGIDPIDMGKFLLDQERFKQTQNADANKFLLDKEKFNYQQGLDKERLTVDRNEAEGKQAERQLARQKYMDESRKAFANEFTFSDPKAPREQIAGAVFDISQATGVPRDVVSQFYEQAVKDLEIDYGKGGPKGPMALNKLVAARITQAYQGQ